MLTFPHLLAKPLLPALGAVPLVGVIEWPGAALMWLLACALVVTALGILHESVGRGPPVLHDGAGEDQPLLRAA